MKKSEKGPHVGVGRASKSMFTFSLSEAAMYKDDLKCCRYSTVSKSWQMYLESDLTGTLPAYMQVWLLHFALNLTVNSDL